MRLTNRKRQAEDKRESLRGNVHALAERHLWRLNWKAEGLPYCGIYAVSPDNRWPTKIGISTAPAKRVIDLQTASWRRLDIAGYAYCESFRDARAVEAKTHELLKGDAKILHGEWFDIKPDKAMEIVAFAAGVLGIELRRDIPNARLEEVLWVFQHNLQQSLTEDTPEEIFAHTGVFVYPEAGL